MHMTLILFTTCFWHVTLVHHYRDYDKDLTREVYLVNPPKIGQKFHFNGLTWKVKEIDPQRVCQPLQHRETETK